MHKQEIEKPMHYAPRGSANLRGSYAPRLALCGVIYKIGGGLDGKEPTGSNNLEHTTCPVCRALAEVRGAA